MSNVTINLTSNSISGLLLARLECDKTLLHGSLRIILKDNPIQCDCKAYSLIEYFQNESNNLQNYVKPCVNIDNDISCITRDKKSVPLSLVNISNMPCDVSDCHECPNNCNCESYIKIETVNMRCENAGLTSVPSLLARSPYEVKMLSLQRNRIKDIDALKDYNLQGLQVIQYNLFIWDSKRIYFVILTFVDNFCRIPTLFQFQHNWVYAIFVSDFRIR